jgi:EAL and modified HD-GYP domain-containing signal transduction protein
MPTTLYADPVRTAKTTESPTGLRYMARQPILDLRGQVYAYELLFRGAAENVFRGDSDQATRSMLDSTLLFGLDRLTNGATAFINCTPEALTESFVGVLQPGLTVLEVLETVEPTPAVIAACQNLKKLGFRIALDDFRWSDAQRPMVELADYIKVDFLQSDERERAMLAGKLHNSSAVMLAEKIETPEEYARARAEGYTLFQGFHFCRPQLMKNRDLAPNSLTKIALLKELHKDPFDQRAIVDLVQRDAALAYRLLRLANSPVFAIRREVRSVRAALIAVGEETFRRMATLTIAGSMTTGRSPEILRIALSRARFCELAARLSSRNANGPVAGFDGGVDRYAAARRRVAGGVAGGGERAPHFPELD